jgi:hypothetical protein
MLRPNWTPDEMAATELSWSSTTLPHDGHVDITDAIRLMVAYEAQAQEWLNHVANAVLYKETAKWRRESQYNLAFMKSEGKSDRQKDAEAKSDALVRAADLKLIEATAALKLAEGRYDSAVRSHHSMKSLMREAAQEKFLG